MQVPVFPTAYGHISSSFCYFWHESSEWLPEILSYTFSCGVILPPVSLPLCALDTKANTFWIFQLIPAASSQWNDVNVDELLCVSVVCLHSCFCMTTQGNFECAAASPVLLVHNTWPALPLTGSSTVGMWQNSIKTHTQTSIIQMCLCNLFVWLRKTKDKSPSLRGHSLPRRNWWCPAQRSHSAPALSWTAWRHWVAS